MPCLTAESSLCMRSSAAVTFSTHRRIGNALGRTHTDRMRMVKCAAAANLITGAPKICSIRAGQLDLDTAVLPDQDECDVIESLANRIVRPVFDLS
jgi:hypothetical protein